MGSYRKRFKTVYGKWVEKNFRQLRVSDKEFDPCSGKITKDGMI